MSEQTNTTELSQGQQIAALAVDLAWAKQHNADWREQVRELAGECQRLGLKLAASDHALASITADLAQARQERDGLHLQLSENVLARNAAEQARDEARKELAQQMDDGIWREREAARTALLEAAEKAERRFNAGTPSYEVVRWLYAIAEAEEHP